MPTHAPPGAAAPDPSGQPLHDSSVWARVFPAVPAHTRNRWLRTGVLPPADFVLSRRSRFWTDACVRAWLARQKARPQGPARARRGRAG